LSDGTRTFTYDAANRLTQVVSGTLTTEYVYLGDGTRLAQRVNGDATRYVVDVSGSLPQVLEERRGANVTRYLYAAGMAATEQDGASGMERWIGWGVITNNLVVMATALTRRRRRRPAVT